MVLALFSIIMYSALQLFDPVSKFFVRSSNFEGNTACLDNIKRAVEGNLKYADRVRAFSEFTPYEEDSEGTPIPSDKLKEHVQQFYDYFFGGRKAIDSAGYIYALVLDNTKVSDAALETDDYPDMQSFIDAGKNSGRIILYKFWFNNYDSNYSSALDVAESAETGYISTGAPPEWNPLGTLDPTPGIQDWYVNRKLYSSAEYRFDLGLVEEQEQSDGSKIMVNVGETAEFVPSNFVLSITQTQLKKNVDGLGLVRDSVTQTSSCSFSMKNVLDSSVGYTKSGIDEYLKLKTGTSETDDDIEYKMEPKNRYTSMQKNPAKSFDGMYFIYTIPETTYTNPVGISHQKKSTS
jgi:hypothetical protein